MEALALAAPSGDSPLEALCGADAGGGDEAATPRHIVAMARPGAQELVFLEAPPIASGSIIVPGSFNPFHEGHEELGNAAATLTGRSPESVLFELCIRNADKGTQPLEEVRRRAEGVAERGHRLLVTTASLYIEKATLCQSCDFVVGYDTYRRIVDPKYYVPPGQALETASPEERRGWVLAALRELSRRGARLLVAGRADGDGSFLDLEQAPLFSLPEDISGLFVHIPGFRIDISSTELREKAKAKAQEPEAGAAAAAPAPSSAEETAR